MLDEFSVSQGRRFYEAIRTLFDVRVGGLISLSGYLVQMDRRNGWKWRSSLRRTDTGAGACDVVWMDRAKCEQVAE